MEDKKLTPIKAIRQKCLDCCADSSLEVKLCEMTNCSLHRFRLGRNPNRTRVMSDAEKEAFRDRMARLREIRDAE